MRQPMLAATLKDEDLPKLKFPMYASVKLDGIRAVVKDGVVLSRSMKPIRNRYVQQYLGQPAFNGYDGELLIEGTFQDTTSGIMSEYGQPDFTYHVFDRWDMPDDEFHIRTICLHGDRGRVVPLPQRKVCSLEELIDYETMILGQGHEGIILRTPHSKYKYGRSTLREQYLLKRKPFLDDEAIIIGFEEQLENTNEPLWNERGYQTRSSAQAGKVGKDTLGKFLVEHPTFGQFYVGSGQGLTHELRQKIWDTPHAYIGRLIKFKYLPIGVKDKPRSPIFLGFRDREDI